MPNLELRLTLADPQTIEQHDVLVTAGPAITIGDLLSATASSFGLAATRTDALWCARRRRAIAASTPLAESGIRWGDRLVVGSRPVSLAPARVAALVTAGPSAGLSVPLADGDHAAGRGPDCDVHVDDPSLSRRHLEIRVDGSTVLVRDAGSCNGSAVDGTGLAAATWQQVRPDERVLIGRTTVRFACEQEVADDAPQRRGRVAFNRMPRVARRRDERPVRLDRPPDSPGRLRLPLVPAAVSMLAGVAMYLLLGSIAMLAFSALGPLMLMSSLAVDWRSGRRGFRRRSQEFRLHLAAAHDELSRVRDRERRDRLAAAPDAADICERVLSRRTDLWERRPADDDFLALRVGLASLPARTAVDLEEGGDGALLEEAHRLLAANGPLSAVPLVLGAGGLAAIGLCGDRLRAEGLARWLVVQAAVLHAPSDVFVCAVVPLGAGDRWEWLKWLPHAATARVLPGLECAVARGDVDAHLLLEHVRALQEERCEARRARIGGARAEPPAHVLLLIDEDVALDRGLVSAVITRAVEGAVTVLWLGRERRDLPGGCGAILELDASIAALDATIVDTGHVDRGVSADGIDAAVAERVARALAPLYDNGADAGRGDIPGRVGLLDALALDAPSASDLACRWSDHDGALKATLGVTAGGMLELDLLTHGPHALIVGTTGSGKSELLRTLVASLAVAYPPDRVSFVLIDYKGSAAFGPCAAFPHVVDVVSNLDEHLAERALVALKAEMRRREALLAAAHAKDLAELTLQGPSSAPPALVIAVDEFAQLRAEVPGFVDGVVDIARRGRSLGIHMVLAAQSLQDAFTPAIRANTNIRVALRVAEDGDSESVIAARDAARIPSGSAHRGRGFVRTGHGELQEFQAAYVSGRSSAAASDDALEIAPFRTIAQEPSAQHARFDVAADTDTDLTALALAARGACQLLDVPLPASPWLAVLPQTLALEALEPGSHGHASIGLVDDPANQRQYVLRLALPDAGHAVLFGGGGSGKSTALRTTALSLAGSSSPSALQLYAVDSASCDLGVLTDLPHCGAVVACSDGERVDRLFAHLVREVEKRTALLARARVASFEQLAEGDRPARIVLLLDDLEGFVEEHDQLGSGGAWARLTRVLANGRSAGVHVVMTAARRGAVPSQVASFIGQRLVLPLPTTDEMLALGVDARSLRGVRLDPGRGFTQSGLELQIARAGGAADELDAIRAAGRELRTRYPGATAPAIGVLGDRVGRETLPRASSERDVAIGIGGDELASATIDLGALHFLVVGPYRSGRTTALETATLALAEARRPPRLALMAPRVSRLTELTIWEHVGRGAGACAELAAQVLDDVRARAAGAAGDPIVLVVDDAGELTDAATIAHLERIVRLGRDTNVRVLAAAETGAARAIGVPWLRELRKEGHGLLLRPDLPGDGDLLGVTLPRRARAPFPEGRGYLAVAGRARLVQVAH